MSVDGKYEAETSGVRGCSSYTNLTGFLLQAGGVGVVVRHHLGDGGGGGRKLVKVTQWGSC